jgi:hypothetical protein
MTGYAMISKIRRIEGTLKSMGMMWGGNPSNWSDLGTPNDRVTIRPYDDALPVYIRNAIIFEGSIEEVDTWVKGIEWARNYDTMMKVSDEKKRAKKEQDMKNDYLIKALAGKLEDSPCVGEN